MPPLRPISVAGPVSSYSATGLFDQPECPVCLDPFEQTRTVVSVNCGHKFHRCCLEEWKRSSVAIAIANRVARPVPTCPLCRAELAGTGAGDSEVTINAAIAAPRAASRISAEVLMSPGSAVRGRNFALARLLATEQGSVLSESELKTALERAARSFNASQARCLLELSSADEGSQAVSRSVLANVLQKAQSEISGLSWYQYGNLKQFIDVFFNHGIRDSVLAKMAVKLFVLRGDYRQAEQFKARYGEQAHATASSPDRRSPEQTPPTPVQDAASLRRELLAALRNNSPAQVRALMCQAESSGLISETAVDEIRWDVVNAALDDNNADIVRVLLW